jgi:hypothetical protein
VSTATPSPTEEVTMQELQPHRSFALALFAQAAGLVLTAMLGPLALGVIEYRYSPTMLSQATGLDAFAVLVVAPIAVFAGVLAVRRNRAAPLLALGPSAFALYMLVQYVIGPEYLTIAGNGERFFLLFVVQFVLSGWILCTAWELALPPSEPSSVLHRRGTTLLVIAAFVVGGMYVANGFLSAMADFPAYVGARAAVSEYDEHPTAYWIVALLDLAVVVPLTVAVGFGLRRGRAWAERGFYAIVGWFALVPGSVAAMAIVMSVRHDPARNDGRAVMFSGVAVVLFLLAARVFVPCIEGGRTLDGDEPQAVGRVRGVVPLVHRRRRHGVVRWRRHEAT